MMRRWLTRLGWSLAILLATLIGATLITLRSGDASLYPPAAGMARVEIFVVSHGYHSGIVLPRPLLAAVGSRNGHGALIAVATRFGAYSWLEFGWGDEGFYRSVPEVASLTLALAARALLRPGNPSVLHVVGLTDHPRAAFSRPTLSASSSATRGSSVCW